MRSRRNLLLFLLLPALLLGACGGGAGSNNHPPLVGELDAIPGLQDETADTDCSYFYFLWAKTSEAQGRLDEALEAYEKAVVCDDESGYVVRHLAALLLRMDRKKQALAWVEKLIAANPDEQRSRIFQADLYASMGDYDKAVALYSDILAADAKSVEVLGKLGKLYLNNLDYTQSRKIFERLAKVDPESFAAHYYLARLYQELNFPRKAIAAFQKALALSWSPQLAFEVANYYESQELFEDAIAIYKQMLAEDQEVETAGGQLVRIYLEQEEPDKAVAVLEEIRKSAMDSKRVDFTMGRIFLEQERYDEAIALFEEMLARDPEMSLARSILALAYYESDKIEQAKELLLGIRKGDKGYDESLFMLVKIYSEEGDYGAATRLIRQAIDESEEDNLQYFLVLASLHEEQQDLEAAEYVLKEAIVVFPESTDAYFKYGMFLERNGRMNDAIAVMQKVLQLNPQEPYALNYIGYTWADRGINLHLALEYIKKAIAIRPDDGFIRDSLGWAYFKLGDVDLAVMELEKANLAEPEDPTILEHLGDVNAHIRKRGKAREYYEKSLEAFDKEADRLRLKSKLEALSR